jgi:predicted acetyltransferase
VSDGNFALTAARPDEQSVLANLLELYAHDFSEFFEIELRDDGRFGYSHLPLYWTEPDRHAFLLRVDGNLAGFALVRQMDGCWDLAEFFIARRYRRQGFGMAAAHELWRRFRGPWTVRVMEANTAGCKFWDRAVAEFKGESIPPQRLEKSGRFWNVYSFDSP